MEIKAETFNELSEKLKNVYYKGMFSSDERSVLAQTIGFLETCHTHMKETVAALEEKINDLEGEKKQLFTIRPPEDLIEDYERCKIQLEETQKILTSTQEELEEVQKREATLNQMEEMNQQCVGHLRNAFKDLQSQLAIATRGQDAQAALLKEHIEHINSLKTQLENTEEESKKHHEKVQHLMKENNSLKEALEKLEAVSETDGQKSNLSALPERQDLASPEIQNERLQEKLRDVCKSCDHLRQVLNDYERINNDLSGRLTTVEKSEQELVEKNLRLYIDYVSAREDIEKLLLQLDHRPSLSGTSVNTNKDVDRLHEVFPDEPDSMGTATSEDEGLGDDSRRGDSTGPSSLTDLHESEEDLLSKSSDLDFGENRVLEHSKPQEFEQMRSRFQQMDSLQQKEKQLSDCLKHSETLVMELQEKLKVKEAQICKLLSENCTTHQSKSEEIKKWQLEMEKQQAKFEDQQKHLVAIQTEKKELQEQLLELEESENDARCGEQKLQEQLKNLLEKQKRLEEKLSDRNRDSEVARKQLMVAEATENELRSQITYMETLVQKYEVHIQDLESSETELQKKVFRLEQMLHQATEENLRIQPTTLKQHSEYSKNTDSSEILDTVNSQRYTPSEICSVEVQVDINRVNCAKSMSDQSTQTEYGSCSHELGKNPLYTLESVFSHPSLCASSEVLSEKQKALLVRLRALEAEDSVLREQLHQMDGLNLVLWQKLYDLGNDVGACKRENVSWEMSFQKGSEEKHYKATARLDDLLTTKNVGSFDKEMQSSLPVQLEVTTSSKLEHRHEHILSRLLSLEGNEQKLKERLWELEKINHEFEKELEIREKLYKEKDKQQQKWMQEEKILKETIQTLNGEKTLLFQKASLLDLEKKNLEKEVENIQKTLQTLKLEHAKELEDLEHRHSQEVANLRTKIKDLEKTIEEITKQISQCPEKEEIVKNESIKKIRDVEVCASSLEDLQTEQDDQKDLDEQVEQNKKQLEALKETHKSEIKLLKSQHLVKESTLEEEIKELRLQELNLNEEIASLREKQSKLEKDLEAKQNELELCNQQYKNSTKLLEEENHLVEAELKWKLKEMEESTTITVTALKEEKQKLELNLQTDLEDLHSKEKTYKFRISELEKQVLELKSEIGKLTEDVSSVTTSEIDINEEGGKLVYVSEREKLLQQRLEEMEKKEAAYRETLESADKIVASLERGYKEKIDELERSERNLKLRVSHLEDIESRLRNALKYEQRGTDVRRSSDLLEELMEAEARESELKDKVCELENTERNLLLKIKGIAKSQEALKDELKEKDDMTQNLENLRQERENLKKELARIHRSENALKETLEEADIILLQRETELNQKIIELEEEKKELEDTVIQLRKDVKQLKDRIEQDINKQITLSCEPFPLLDSESEEPPVRNEETFYTCGRQDWKIREQECVEADLRLEITRLRQCLSASNSHLADLDSVRRNQEDVIATLEQDKTLLQEELIQLRVGAERSQGLCDIITQLEEEKKQLLQRIEKIDIEEQWRESLIKVNAQLQEQ
ncbi:putative leucine-rich repeat-containing protein DDB_G0290503, partial [Limulus polyphemus]|uniref:Leucine-rich repeat-containing protein DDB_G0290503 n=1 Tax=Limulus polyphemus TaxID=6850 RepID=A0ABM1BYW8_LIMPO